jgi:hypothetical protein
MNESTDGSSDRKRIRTVAVTFDANHQFEFSCDSTTMRRPGNILLQRDSDDVSWTFVSVDLPNPPFTWSRAPDGSSLTITDDYSVHDRNFSYRVTVLEGQTPYTSPSNGSRTPPPMIRNQ